MPKPRPAKRIEPAAPPGDFRAAVLAVVARIPEGSLASYGQVALLAGFPQRPRQVGMVLSGLPEGTDLPWHRVVNTQGYVPSRGRWWGAFEQIARLRDEGIAVDDQGNLDLEAHRWDGADRAPKTAAKRLGTKKKA
ncbi:MGMT family protein [Geothrix campi]|uniref:MGMT family protein n=1 Tax=Geothrix campi TaxID=2966450 RepID=UPI0021477B39|nr:MGMT family protein [Geothrix sp. SG10]